MHNKHMFEVIFAAVVSSVLLSVAVAAGVAHHAHYKPPNDVNDINKYFVDSLLEYNHVNELERKEYVTKVRDHMKSESDHDTIATAFLQLGKANMDTIYNTLAKEQSHHFRELIEMYFSMDMPPEQVRRELMKHLIDHKYVRMRKDMEGCNWKKVKKKLCN